MKQKTTNIKSESTNTVVPVTSNNRKDLFFKPVNSEFQPFFGPDTIQPKLRIGQSNDEFEQQANRVADTVVQMPDTQIRRQPIEEEEEMLQTKEMSGIQRKCTECEHDEEQVQKKKNANTHLKGITSETISRQLKSGSGSGSRLPYNIQSEMNRKIGADFRDVNIHTGSHAVQINRSLRSRAFTHGNDIYFNSGEFSPGTSGGKHLLAHELTHVIQQNGISGNNYRIQKQEIEVPSPDAEEEDNFEFNFEALPPALQFTIGNWMLEANTGSAELQFTQDLFEYSFGYRFGSEIFAGVEGPGMSSRVGVNPATGATSLGFTRDRFRFSGSFNPSDTSVGVNIGYGASLLPMPSSLQESVHGGWSGITSIYKGLGSIRDPFSFYQSHSDDVGAVMGAVRALQPLADEESAQFGAGLRFTYNPQTGALISGGMQWLF